MNAQSGDEEGRSLNLHILVDAGAPAGIFKGVWVQITVMSVPDVLYNC